MDRAHSLSQALPPPPQQEAAEVLSSELQLQAQAAGPPDVNEQEAVRSLQAAYSNNADDTVSFFLQPPGGRNILPDTAISLHSAQPADSYAGSSLSPSASTAGKLDQVSAAPHQHAGCNWPSAGLMLGSQSIPSDDPLSSMQPLPQASGATIARTQSVLSHCGSTQAASSPGSDVPTEPQHSHARSHLPRQQHAASRSSEGQADQIQPINSHLRPSSSIAAHALRSVSTVDEQDGALHPLPSTHLRQHTSMMRHASNAMQPAGDQCALDAHGAAAAVPHAQAASQSAADSPSDSSALPQGFFDARMESGHSAAPVSASVAQAALLRHSSAAQATAARAAASLQATPAVQQHTEEGSIMQQPTVASSIEHGVALAGGAPSDSFVRTRSLSAAPMSMPVEEQSRASARAAAGSVLETALAKHGSGSQGAALHAPQVAQSDAQQTFAQQSAEADAQRVQQASTATAQDEMAFSSLQPAPDAIAAMTQAAAKPGATSRHQHDACAADTPTGADTTYSDTDRPHHRLQHLFDLPVEELVPQLAHLQPTSQVHAGSAKSAGVHLCQPTANCSERLDVSFSCCFDGCNIGMWKAQLHTLQIDLTYAPWHSCASAYQHISQHHGTCRAPAHFSCTAASHSTSTRHRPAAASACWPSIAAHGNARAATGGRKA